MPDISRWSPTPSSAIEGGHNMDARGEQHSGLEVIYDRGGGLEVVRDGADGLQVVHGNEEKIVVVQQDREEWARNGIGKGSNMPQAATARRQLGRFRCGSRTSYVLVGVIVAVIISGAVGGGVGGTLASRKASNADSNLAAVSNSQLSTTMDTVHTATSSESTTSMMSTSTVITTSTIDVPGRPSLDPVYRDCPSSNNTIYTAPSQESEPILFRKVCGQSFLGGLDWRVTSDVLPGINNPARSLDDCIGSCVLWNTDHTSEIASGQAYPCNSVCWRNGVTQGDDFPYQCFGGFVVNASTGFRMRDEAQCDSAAWINQGF